MAKVKHGNFVMDETKDADLQQDFPRTKSEIERNWQLYWNQALKIIFAKVKEHSGGKIDLDPQDFATTFVATQRAPLGSAIPTGGFKQNGLTPSSFVPVEWKMRTSSGHATTATNWQLMIDLDDIPPGASGPGPDRPHIGYLLTSKGQTKKRVDGHIFIEHVIASRNSDGCENTVAAKCFVENTLGGGGP